MKKYNISLNGKKYYVEIEEVGGGADNSAVSNNNAAAQSPSGTSQEGNVVKSPLPGTVLDVRVSANETVKKSQVLFVIEAMKMENEILAPCDGRVVSVNVSKGNTIESGSILCTIV